MTSVDRDGIVEFRFFRPNVRQVAIVGDFNGWRRDALLMAAEENGWWRAEARLNPGDYRFRYLADGVWYTDFASNGVEHGKWGCNSLLMVPETANREAPRQVA